MMRKNIWCSVFLAILSPEEIVETGQFMRRFVFGKPGLPVVALLTGLLLWVGSVPAASATTICSSWVFHGATGWMISQPEALGNRVLDYSGAGDDVTSIQAAITTVLKSDLFRQP
jgi:hypothetical protein